MIKRRKPETLTLARAKALTHEVVDEFFEMWTNLLTKYDLVNKPDRIYNCDEAGFSTSPISSTSSVYVETLRKDAYRKAASCGKVQYTVLWCASASGVFVPPFTIYKAKYSYKQWEEDAIPGAKFDVSKSGWMEKDNFWYWMKHVFIVNTNHLARPVVLCMDGHSSHLSYKTLLLAKDHNIILVALPPNTSHALQPFDVAVFFKLKTMWRKILQENEIAKQYKPVSKNDFPRLMKFLWFRLGRAEDDPNEKTEVLSNESIIGGFRDSGLLPIDKTKLNRRIVEVPQEEEQLPDIEIESPRKKVARIIAKNLTPEQPTARAANRQRTAFQYKAGEVLTNDDSIARFRLQEEARDAKKAGTAPKKKSATKVSSKKRGANSKKATPAKRTKKDATDSTTSTPTTSGKKSASGISLFRAKKGVSKKKLGILASFVDSGESEVEVSSTDTSVDSDEEREFNNMRNVDTSDDINLSDIVPSADEVDDESPPPGPSKPRNKRSTKSKSSLLPPGRSPSPPSLRDSENEDDPHPYGNLQSSPFKIVVKQGDMVIVYIGEKSQHFPALVRVVRPQHIDTALLTFNSEEKVWENKAKKVSTFTKNQIIATITNWEMVSTVGYHIPPMTNYGWPMSKSSDDAGESVEDDTVEDWRNNLIVGNFVIVDYMGANFPGEITEILPDLKFKVSCYSETNGGWVFPDNKDEEIYSSEEIMAKICAPGLVEGRRHFGGLWSIPEMKDFKMK